MAIRHAVASGLWSAPATWNGGTLPAADDDVRANSYTVTVDGDRTARTVSNKSEAGVASGGSFVLADGVTLTTTDGYPLLVASGIVYAGATPQSATLVGPEISCPNAISGAVRCNGSGTLHIVGNISYLGGGFGGLIGNYGAGRIQVTGNLLAGFMAINHSAGVIEITGNVTGGGFPSISNNSGGTIRVIGSVTGTGANPTNAAIVNAAAGVVEIYGPCIAGPSPAVGLGSMTQITRLSGPLICGPGLTMPVTAAAWRWTDTAPATYMEVATHDAAGMRNLYTADYAGLVGFPVAANVRAGVVYGPTNDFAGTLAVPPAATVALGIPVDNTVGTAAITQQAIADAVGPLLAAYGA